MKIMCMCTCYGQVIKIIKVIELAYWSVWWDLSSLYHSSHRQQYSKATQTSEVGDTEWYYWCPATPLLSATWNWGEVYWRGWTQKRRDNVLDLALSLCLLEMAHHTSWQGEETCSSRPNPWICWEIDWYVGQLIVLGNSRDWVSMYAWRASSIFHQVVYYSSTCRCWYVIHF